MPLGLGQNKVDTSILPSRGVAPTLPLSFGERFLKEFEAYRLADLSIAEDTALYDGYEKAIDAAYQVTGERAKNPMAGPEPGIPGEFWPNAAEGEQPFSKFEAEQSLSDILQRAKGIDQTIPSIEQIKQGVYDRAKVARDDAFKAGLVSSPWTEPAAFLGTVAGAMTDPLNFATLPLGAPARLSGSVALRTIKAMLIEGGIAAATQTAIELKTAEFKKAANVETNALANIFAAGIGGGVLAGGARGVLEAINSRIARGLGLSLDELDSLAVAGRYSRDMESAPKGMNVDQHLEALNAAIESVAKGEPIVPQGPFSFVSRPARFFDAIDAKLEMLKVRNEWLDVNLRNLGPQPSQERLELLARVNQIEQRLAAEDVTKSERKILANRRDELFADVTPETLRAEGGLAKERLNIENEKAAITKEINQINQDRTLDPGWRPGPDIRKDAVKQIVAEEKARMLVRKPEELESSALGEARRIAASTDSDIPTSSGKSMKASELLEEAAEQKRVAQEIADACLMAGKAT